jgi:putative ABC transport system permease protein
MRLNARFALAMARREARASRRRFALYGGCMALGIAALVGLQGLRASVTGAVAAQSQRLLGADLRLESREPFAPEIEALAAALGEASGAPPAQVTRFGSMLLAPSGRSRLVDVHGVEGGFPFYGEVATSPEGLWGELARDAPVALLDPGLLLQLDAAVGDTLTLGRARFRVAGVVLRAPGGLGLRARLAPRVFIPRARVEQTGLIQPGSLREHLLYLRAPAERLRPWLDAHRAGLRAARVRVETPEEHAEDLSRGFGTLTRYLGLVGLAALSLAGVGIAAGARVFVREKLDTVAVLRALGASSRDVLAAYAPLAAALGAGAGLAGAALGSALQWGLPHLLAPVLPARVESGFEPAAVATGVVLGLWLALLFCAAPLFDLAQAPPLRALRRDFAGERMPRAGRAALASAVAASLLAASLWQAPRPLLGLAFGAGLAAALAALALAARGATALLRRRRPRRAPYWLRQGIANLFRPRNHTAATVVAVGFGLFLLATLAGVRHNVLRELAADAAPGRPNIVLFDVQPDEREALRAFAAGRGAAPLEEAPLVSARLAAVNGQPVGERLRDESLERELRWALSREYRATYAPRLRESEALAAGRWWTPAELAGQAPAAVSLETEIADALGVGPGDALTWDVQGVAVESVVRSLRDVDWGHPGVNFFVVFAPGALEQAPQTSVMLLRIEDADARAAFQRDLAGRFPSVSALDASLVLAALGALLRELSVAVRLLALFVLATGLAVLVAAAAASRDERTREALLLRTLGASSGCVRRILATEAAALACLATGVGTALGVAASLGLVRLVFELPFEAPWGELLALALATFAVGAGLGASGGGPGRSGSALAALREAEQSGAGAG